MVTSLRVRFGWIMDIERCSLHYSVGHIHRTFLRLLLLRRRHDSTDIYVEFVVKSTGSAQAGCVHIHDYSIRLMYVVYRSYQHALSACAYNICVYIFMCVSCLRKLLLWPHRSHRERTVCLYAIHWRNVCVAQLSLKVFIYSVSVAAGFFYSSSS